jgi:hypothetical protein
VRGPSSEEDHDVVGEDALSQLGEDRLEPLDDEVVRDALDDQDALPDEDGLGDLVSGTAARSRRGR